MGIVRGLGSRVGVEISEDTTGSTYPYTTSNTWYRVPLLSDSFKLNRNPYNDLNEIGTLGGRESIEFGRSDIGGEFTVVPRYEAKWFNILLGHAMGAETLVTGYYLDRATTAAGGVGNTHVYHFHTSTPNGLTIRIYKSGDDASGILETYNGCLISGFTVEQPEGDVLRVTFRFVGHSVTLTQAGSDPIALASDTIVNVRDIVSGGSRTRAEFKTGSDYSNTVSLDSFTLECDRKITPEGAFITSPDDMEKPGITEIRDITFTLNSKLEQVDPTSALKYPYVEYLNNTASALSVIYESLTEVVTTYGYSFRINVPEMKWESAEAPLADGGPVVLRANSRAQLKTLASPDGHETVGSPADLRLFTYVSEADEPATDDHYTHADSGVEQSP